MLAAGSGVGQAAIQIAVLHGARVFATAGLGREAGARAIAWRPRGHSPSQAGRGRRGDAAHEPARRRRRRRACRRRDMGREHALAGARRPAGDVRRHDRPAGRVGPAAAVRQAAVGARVLRRHEGRAAARGAVFLLGRAPAGRRSDLSRWRRRPMRSGGWRRPNTSERSSSRSDAVSASSASACSA